MKKLYTLLIFFLIHSYIAGESVKLVKIINLGAEKKSKTLADLILGRKKGIVINPSGLLVFKNMFIIIDQVNSRLLVTDRDGNIQKKITGFGSNRFISPVSGTLGENGAFFISDSAQKVVVRFLGHKMFDKIIFSEPNSRITGMAYFKGRLYCTDTENHRIIVLDNSGKTVLTYGKRGGGAGEFNFPTHIHADRAGIYVTDALNFRVQIFDHSGNFLRVFGKNGKYGGEFSKPKAIAVDRAGRIFVSDVDFDNIQIFDKNGRFLFYFGGPGKGDGDFWMPGGITIDSQDRIYVSDTYNRRIKVYLIIQGRQ